MDFLIFSLLLVLPYLLLGACCISRSLGGSGDCNTSQAGGILTYYLFNYKDLQAWTKDACGNINTITLCYGKCAYEWQPLDETGQVTETISKNGGSYTAGTQLVGNFIADTCDRLTAVKQLVGSRVIAIWQDNNGKWYIAGLISPFKLTTSVHATGLLGTDANNHVITLDAIENAITGGAHRVWFGVDGDADALRDQLTRDGLNTLACLGASNNCGCDVGN